MADINFYIDKMRQKIYSKIDLLFGNIYITTEIPFTMHALS